MPQADVLSLVNLLSTGLRDSTAASNYYTRIVLEHGSMRTSLTDATYVAGVADQLTYSKPTAAIRILGVFYDQAWLYGEDERSLQRFDPFWRELSGAPAVYSFDAETLDTIAVVPRPARSGAAIGVTTPFTGFPSDNLTVVYTNNAADVQPWEELAVACDILAREFGRWSDHQDTSASATWRQLADFFLTVTDNAQSAA